MRDEDSGIGEYKVAENGSEQTLVKWHDAASQRFRRGNSPQLVALNTTGFLRLSSNVEIYFESDVSAHLSA